MLCSPKLHHQQQPPRRRRHHHHSHNRHQSQSAPAVSSRIPASEDEMQTTRSSDIQAHLQSMFHILRPDDSLNMVRILCIIRVYCAPFISNGNTFCIPILNIKYVSRTLRELMRIIIIILLGNL